MELRRVVRQLGKFLGTVQGKKEGSMGELLAEERDDVVELVADIDRTAEALPEEEREAYDAAQESVVEARRSAELHEGQLQVN